MAVSTGRCNARLQSHAIEERLGAAGQVAACGEVLAQQSVGVFVRAALPGALRKHDEAGAPLHEGGDLGARRSARQIALPVAGASRTGSRTISPCGSGA